MSRLEYALAPKDIKELSIGNVVEIGPYGFTASVFDFGPIKYVAITAFNGGQSIGICDFRYTDNVKNATLDSPIIVKRPDLIVSGIDLRVAAGVDGVYVDKRYRKQGVGSVLIKMGIDTARELGAHRFIINQPNVDRFSWFKKLGGKEVLGAFIFNLN
ncbi:hypothetical protein A3A46_02610 [Candidatus Roizmanbacteria bacterium RIFCSPLOWO2_01_FULL_37_13]|uniref:N-acetyltransferase domain-containing protein n=1 Tax=Candidatus Roizmanbacteria bacterium RIFCSPHIGHO2_02_FULL_38_11 TaxID=1802039 RepID=A0A1F7H3A3_9BACT|nr:MAG: hypothetical protein A3C25_04175 [Candidatus Roizmanbacteria bacterium RIFCSPHIGHO2_02_FULL_38_11]OGK41464.1 MAG: hypothetical protein A3A46_02610 [Candidatus Roizmanbacteria bacterium RIFCSPLOWO2_01_FULL_37_13]